MLYHWSDFFFKISSCTHTPTLSVLYPKQCEMFVVSRIVDWQLRDLPMLVFIITKCLVYACAHAHYRILDNIFINFQREIYRTMVSSCCFNGSCCSFEKKTLGEFFSGFMPSFQSICLLTVCARRVSSILWNPSEAYFRVKLLLIFIAFIQLLINLQVFSPTLFTTYLLNIWHHNDILTVTWCKAFFCLACCTSLLITRYHF